jgi:uroporphyrin-III C-methyltransferase
VVSLRSQLRSLIESRAMVSEREQFLKVEAGHE